MNNETIINAVEVAFNVVIDNIECDQLLADHAYILKHVLTEMGIDVFPSDNKWEDWLFGRDGYPNLVGRYLLHSSTAVDWTTPNQDRRPTSDPKEGEWIYQYGDAHIGYYVVGPRRPICPMDILINVHRITSPLVEKLIKEALKKRASDRKNWGKRTNSYLKEAGCSDAEISAWWGLEWKKEWSPEEWAELCQTCSKEQVTFGLSAHSHRYIQACGLGINRSFPRTMDAIRQLAVAKGIKKGRKLPKSMIRSDIDVTPTALVKGAAVWSF